MVHGGYWPLAHPTVAAAELSRTEKAVNGIVCDLLAIRSECGIATDSFEQEQRFSDLQAHVLNTVPGQARTQVASEASLYTERLGPLPEAPESSVGINANPAKGDPSLMDEANMPEVVRSLIEADLGPEFQRHVLEAFDHQLEIRRLVEPAEGQPGAALPEPDEVIRLAHLNKPRQCMLENARKYASTINDLYHRTQIIKARRVAVDELTNAVTVLAARCAVMSRQRDRLLDYASKAGEAEEEMKAQQREQYEDAVKKTQSKLDALRRRYNKINSLKQALQYECELAENAEKDLINHVVFSTARDFEVPMAANRFAELRMDAEKQAEHCVAAENSARSCADTAKNILDECQGNLQKALDKVHEQLSDAHRRHGAAFAVFSKFSEQRVQQAYESRCFLAKKLQTHEKELLEWRFATQPDEEVMEEAGTSTVEEKFQKDFDAFKNSIKSKEDELICWLEAQQVLCELMESSGTNAALHSADNTESLVSDDQALSVQRKSLEKAKNLLNGMRLVHDRFGDFHKAILMRIDSESLWQDFADASNSLLLSAFHISAAPAERTPTGPVPPNNGSTVDDKLAVHPCLKSVLRDVVVKIESDFSNNRDVFLLYRPNPPPEGPELLMPWNEALRLVNALLCAGTTASVKCDGTCDTQTTYTSGLSFFDSRIE